MVSDSTHHIAAQSVSHSACQTVSNVDVITAAEQENSANDDVSKLNV